MAGDPTMKAKKLAARMRRAGYDCKEAGINLRQLTAYISQLPAEYRDALSNGTGRCSTLDALVAQATNDLFDGRPPVVVPANPPKPASDSLAVLTGLMRLAETHGADLVDEATDMWLSIRNK